MGCLGFMFGMAIGWILAGTWEWLKWPLFIWLAFQSYYFCKAVATYEDKNKGG